MNKPLRFLSAAFMLLAASLLLPGKALAEYDLGTFNIGSHVTGPNFSGKQIKGKVVVIKYWGITCGPCLQAIPHTSELAKKYGHDKLVVIANQVWSASDNRTAETWKGRAKNDMVMVVNKGSLDGFSPRGVPRALIFDHTGKSVWEGHPGSMDKPLADAIANLPEAPEEPESASEESAAEASAGPQPIIAGFEPEFFVRESNLINAQNRNAASTLGRLRRATEQATDPAQAKEAKAIVAAVESWAKAKQDTIDATLKNDPATAYTVAEELHTLLKGDALADQASEVITAIRKDKPLFDAVRATIALR
ncbi:MAG: TlpA disulfide reductase family protein, partial [Planctomycetota bacterium]